MRLAVVAVLSLFPAAAFGQPPLPRLEPLARIGCVDCDGPTLFAGIQAVAVQGELIYVIDRSPPYVRIFDTEGRTIRAFARTGSGPGELRLPITVAPRASGELEVFDMTLQSFIRYDSTGRSLGTRRIDGFAAVTASAPGSAIVWLLQTDFRSTDQPLLRVPDGATDAAVVVTLNADFPRLEPGELARTPSLAADHRGGLAVGDGIAEYRIRRFDANGRSLGDIVRTIPKQRKSAEELDVERERMQRRGARIAEMVGAEGGRPRPRSFTPRPERNHFNMDALEFDENGQLWVRTERGGLDATVFDLFDTSGRYIGEVRVPMRVGPYGVSGGLLVGRVMNDDEVEFVQVWRIR